MSIDNDEDLEKAVERASALLQEIHDYCAGKGRTWVEVPEAKVRFPRGFIRAASTQRRRISFVGNADLKSNLAYTLILSDAVLWLSIRTDLWGVPQEMLTKLYGFLLGSLCESLTKDYLKGICGRNYKGRTEYLAEKEIISEELKDELDWLWDARNRMHFFKLPAREYINDYDIEFHARAVAAFRGLIKNLEQRGRIDNC